jgi:hypothetical protein
MSVIHLTEMGMACEAKAPEKPAAQEEVEPAEARSPPKPATVPVKSLKK